MGERETLVRVYDNLADAESARETLLRAGFHVANVRLTVNHDEAGAVEGNFCVGNARLKEGFLDPRINAESAVGDYEQNYSKAVQRGNCLLTVETQNEAQLTQAKNVTSKFNPVGPK